MLFLIYFFNLSLPNRFRTLLSILKKNFKKLFYFKSKISYITNFNTYMKLHLGEQ